MLKFLVWNAVKKSDEIVIQHVEMDGWGGGVHVTVKSFP